MSDKPLNGRQEAFARAIVEGMTAEQAYVAAGYSADRSRAAKLSAKAHIQARIAELRIPAAAAAGVTLAGHLAKLAEIRDAALAAESFGAAVAAEVAIGKHSGVSAAEKREVKVEGAKPEALSDEELIAAVRREREVEA